MSVHEVAADGFSTDPDRYERGRPSYPAAAVAWLVDNLGVTDRSRIVDLAAGTGKLTRLLVPTGADLIAVEPVDAMARAFKRYLPDIPVVAAIAERLPFEQGSVDAVLVGQAFHWFDAPSAWRELARVVRPGGGVGLIWNVRDRSVPWIDEVWKIMDEVEKRAPWRDHDRHGRLGLNDRPGFGELHQAAFHHAVSATLDQIGDRFASVSHVAVLPEADRTRVLDRVRQTLLDHPEAWSGDRVTLHYRVDTYWTTRTS